MIQLLTKTYSFEEYLVYDDGTDNKYELVNGQLQLIPTASGFHALIVIAQPPRKEVKSKIK